MNATVTQARYTPEDLLTMPEGERYELVNGELVERNVSTIASYVGGLIYRLLCNFCLEKRVGWVFPDGISFQCFPFDPDLVRKPDVAFIRLNRLTADQAAEKGHCHVTPDLAVEVLSPGDTAYQVDEKVRDFIRAGTRLFWVVNPQVRTLEIHRASGPGSILGENDEVTGEDVMPGFRCRVGEFFILPTDVAASS
jgi:Uma2 family endonuclease